MGTLNRRQILAGSAAVALAPRFAKRAEARTLRTIRVGSQPAEFTADLIYAMELGYFEKQGITIELQMMTNGSATSAAIIGGSLDVGLTDPLTVAEAHVNGVDLVFIAPGAGFAPPWPLAFATHPDLNIRTAKDFNGRTIATNSLRNAPSVMAYYWLDHNGGDSKSVKWIEVPFSAGVAAIQAKRIEGELFGEPFVSMARDTGLHITLMEHNTSAGLWMVNGWMAKRDWVAQNLDLVRGFGTAIADANRWANANPALTIPIVAKYTKLDESTVKGMMPHPWIDKLRAELVQPVLDTCVSYGVLTKPVRAKDIFYDIKR